MQSTVINDREQEGKVKGSQVLADGLLTTKV